MSTCVIINQSTHVTNAEVQAVLPAINRWSGLVDTAWDCDPTTVVLGTSTAGATFGVIYLQDGLDVQGAAGYHDVVAGRPVGKVDVAGTIAAGMSWTVTLTHELGEMKIDPWCLSAAQYIARGFVAQEICDATEDDQYALIIGLVKCSDFVYPNYFEPGSKGPWDYKGALKGPAPAMLPGGYLSVWKGQWTQITQDEQLPAKALTSRRHALRLAWEATLTE